MNAGFDGAVMAAITNEFVAIVEFLWSLHRDVGRLGEQVAALGERTAGLEGLMGGLRDAATGRRSAEAE